MSKKKRQTVNLMVPLQPQLHARLKAAALQRSVRAQRIVGMSTIVVGLIRSFVDGKEGGDDQE